ncbi:hypothetical protein WAK64_06480 [Bacillus spongiae]|uniref:Uncharacterized protein n=1 Tax=Bacillus spongiae TaxID=2683610 RepID=A0ABU8HC02_9BACI
MTWLYISLIPVAGIVSFGWSWYRLLDFNSYKKPHREGTFISFIIFLVGSLWSFFTVEDTAQALVRILFYLIAFLVLLFLNGSILRYLFEKKTKENE